jgi:two-component system cell cycle sensor histidine kinase/response regulator CckA
MTRTVLLGLILNAGLLLGLAVVLDLVSARTRLGRAWYGRTLAGLAAGLIGIGLMATPIYTEPGVQFDTRSVLLAVTGVFLGPGATLVAMLMTAMFRVWIGGAWTVGLMVILASGGIGLLWRSRLLRTSGTQRIWSLYALGIVVHVVMLALIATIPGGAGPRALDVIAVPVIIVYPLATVALGLLLTQRLERENTIEKIQRHDVERERLIAAIEQSDDSIVITNASGVIEYVNPAFVRVSGYSRQEALGANPRILKSGEQNADTYRQLWQTLLSGNTWRGRLVNKRKDGTLYAEDATISPVRAPDGQLASFVAVKRDVTRELELQAQYLQSQKMESVGRLAAGVAHDFNNLLTIINGSAELATHSMAPDDPALEDLRQILAAGSRAGALTRQLLAFSRQDVVMPVVLDLDEVIDGFRKMLARLLQEHIVLEVRAGLGRTRVKADPGQLEQLILNLAVNARDAMASGGTLRIETRVADLGADEAAALRPPVPPGRFACIQVVDTGAGMDPATQAHMFEPFFTTKAIGKGTGLGLATVLHIVEKSGGGIRVRSTVGEGTCFEVFFPEVTGPSAMHDDVDVTTEDQSPHGTVLVVEDEEMLRVLAVRALSQAGFRVVAVANGREGITAAQQLGAPLDLVITDVIMPEMGGREMAQILTRERPTLPILYTSGYTGDIALVEWLSSSGAAFLPKPYSPAELVKAASSVIRQHDVHDDRRDEAR